MLCDREMCLTVVQGPGETMFVPSGWHHQVHNEADTLSVNHNWLTSASLDRAAEFLLKESHAVRTALADLRPSARDPNTGEMDEAERAWMGHCERLQEANAAMGLSDFLRMLDVFSTASALKVSGNAEADSLAGGDAHGSSNEWRAAHELESVARVTKRLLEDWFVAGCSELRALATSILRRIDEALSCPEAAEACRQLRAFKVRYASGNRAAQTASGNRGGVQLRLDISTDGRCKLALDH